MNMKKKYGDCAKYFSVVLTTYGLLNDAFSAAGSKAMDVETDTTVNNELCVCVCVCACVCAAAMH
jgi:hypothetical protein